MTIVGDGDRTAQQAARLQRLSGWLGPSGRGALAVGGVGWALVLILPPLGVSQATIVPLLTAAALLCLGGLYLPRLADAFAREAADLRDRLTGLQETIDLLRTLLDERWTFFRATTPPDGRGRLDGVLVGPGGVFALLVQRRAGVWRNAGETWQQRDAHGRWQNSADNPTLAARTLAERLTSHLERAGLNTAVQARVVWSGEALLLAEQPAVPVWLLNAPAAVQDDLTPPPGDAAATAPPASLLALLTRWSGATPA